jgi:L-ascorbate metabolism protein UlaG (beta-lactamase superfamily)
MKKSILTILTLFVFTLTNAQNFNPDVYETSKGKLTISFIGHGTLMFQFNGKIIQVDPWGKLADYSVLPKADLILITHAHGDHLDTAAIRKTSKSGTLLISTAEVVEKIKQGEVMKNGDTRTILGLSIEAVPAYNSTPGKEKFHPKGRDNGYIIQFGNKKVYVAGDTEDIPEMALLKNIDIAFLPVNQPYTMLPEQLAHAVQLFKPSIVYPYHFGETDMSKVQELLKPLTYTKLIVKAMK